MSQTQVQQDQKQQSTKTNHGIMGIFAGALVGTLLQPLEILKIGMIIGPANNATLKKKLQKGNIITHTSLITKHIYKTEGLKGFYRSYIPCLFRSGGGSGVYFFSLQQFDNISKKYFLDKSSENYEKKQKQAHFINSALARMSSTILINPFAVVGSRIEVPGFNEYSSMRDGFKQIYYKVLHQHHNPLKLLEQGYKQVKKMKNKVFQDSQEKYIRRKEFMDILEEQHQGQLKNLCRIHQFSLCSRLFIILDMGKNGEIQQYKKKQFQNIKFQ